MWIRRLARHVSAFVLTTLVAGLLGATLVRFGPGFEADDQRLDPRLNESSIQALEQSHAGERNVFQYYSHYLVRMLRGDFGVSRSLSRPVSELLAERARVTLQLMIAGIAGGWLLGLLLAVPAAVNRAPLYDLITTSISGFFLCVPSAVLALFLFFANGPAKFAIALVIFPNVFRYARNLIIEAYGEPHVFAAQARGLLRDGRADRHPVSQPWATARIPSGSIPSTISCWCGTGTGTQPWTAWCSGSSQQSRRTKGRPEDRRIPRRVRSARDAP